MEPSALFALQAQAFRRGGTLSVGGRIARLQLLQKTILDHLDEIAEALREDLGKSPAEAYETETGIVLSELRHTLRHLERWTKPKAAPTPLPLLPGRSRVYRDPHGVCLILSPWNYPFQLALIPLIGAIAGGNCVILRPSSQAPATAALLERLLSVFPKEEACVLRGGRETGEMLLSLPFDFIFFTGSPQVGKTVMGQAARHLTPVVLELGGKSPVLVTKQADLSLAARRILFGKGMNAGQTCVAPDYVLCDRAVLPELLSAFEKELSSFFGGDPLHHPDWPRIVNGRHFDRLAALMKASEGSLVSGGRADRQTLRIEPSLYVTEAGSLLMEEELFGPLLPILPYDTLDGALSFVADRPRPLALYLFSKDRAEQRRVLSSLRFGGACVNDTLMHLASPHLPFGGTGQSGMGFYHGRYSFETFTRPKSVLTRLGSIDPSLRTLPASERSFSLLKKFLR